MQKGKKLENDIKKYLKMNGDFYHKFTDSYGARGFSAPVPADFIIFPSQGKAILLECKETQKQNIPLTAFRPAQFKAMWQSIEVESCAYYVIINHDGGYYLIYAQFIIDRLEEEAKSLDLSNVLKFDNINQVMDFMFGENSEN